MKVGDYIRTKNGISKVKEIHEVVTTDNEYITTLISTDNGTCGEENVIKYSQNIIDLIEENDFINGMKIAEIINNKNGVLKCMVDSDYEFVTTILNNEIESVLTKEQFEAMQYKVGE